MTYPEIQTLLFTPPPSATMRAVEGLEPLADLLDQHTRAKSAVQAAGDAYRACLPPDGDAWLSARTDPKKGAQVLARIPTRYAEWSAAAAEADRIAIEAALFRDNGNAGRDVQLALAELDKFLAGLPREWDTDDDPARAIARAEARLKADHLRRSLWSVQYVRAWFDLPSRIGWHPISNIGDRPPQAVNGWPLGDLSPAARDGLNALLGVQWALTPVAGLITSRAGV